MYIARSMAVFFALFGFATHATAGAWLQPEGQGLFITQATYFTSDTYYDQNGQRRSQPEYRKYELQPYAEYGLYKNLTIGGTAFLQNDHQSGKTNNGLADSSIFLRTQIWHDETQVVSIQPLLKFESAFEHEGSPRGGSGSTDTELSLLYGDSIEIFSARDYVDFRAGYRHRSGQLKDQYHFDMAVGLNVSDHWQLIPAIRTIVASEVPENTAFSQNGDQDYSATKMELGAYYRFEAGQTVGLTVSNIVSGYQAGGGTGVTVSYGQSI